MLKKERTLLNRQKIRHTRKTYGFLKTKEDPSICETRKVIRVKYPTPWT